MKNILIIGCGLLGSSLVRRISKKKIARKIFIFEKSKSNISKIKRLKLPGKIVKSLKDGVVNSDLIIFCTPMSEYKNLINSMNELNEKLENLLGTKNQLIGHTFFMKEKLDKNELRHIWERKIEPQLEEYFYDDEQKLANFQFDTLFN